jgi:hypothetical protein
MTDITNTVDTYLAAYNEADEATRLRLLEDAFNQDGRLIDPPLDGSGVQGISDMMAAVHQQFPGHSFRRATGVDEHHGHLRYGWEMVGPDGAVVITGMDVGEITHGRLARITGFFDPLPALA